MLDFSFQGNRPLRREITSERLNEILRELRRVRPVAGNGINVDETGGGCRISLVDDGRSVEGGAPRVLHPFQIFASPKEGGGATVRVRPGTINSVLPDNVFSGNKLAERSIGQDSLSHVKLVATSDSRQITSATIVVSGSTTSAQTPVAFSLPSTAEFLLGVVYNTTVYQVAFNNFIVTGKQQYIASKTSPGLGELPYEVFYAWG
jgi:hypothetical protein